MLWLSELRLEFWYVEVSFVLKWDCSVWGCDIVSLSLLLGYSLFALSYFLKGARLFSKKCPKYQKDCLIGTSLLWSSLRKVTVNDVVTVL